MVSHATPPFHKLNFMVVDDFVESYQLIEIVSRFFRKKRIFFTSVAVRNGKASIIYLLLC